MANAAEPEVPEAEDATKKKGTVTAGSATPGGDKQGEFRDEHGYLSYYDVQMAPSYGPEDPIAGSIITQAQLEEQRLREEFEKAGGDIVAAAEAKAKLLSEELPEETESLFLEGAGATVRQGDTLREATSAEIPTRAAAAQQIAGLKAKGAEARIQAKEAEKERVLEEQEAGEIYEEQWFEHAEAFETELQNLLDTHTSFWGDDEKQISDGIINALGALPTDSGPGGTDQFQGLRDYWTRMARDIYNPSSATGKGRIDINENTIWTVNKGQK